MQDIEKAISHSFFLHLAGVITISYSSGVGFNHLFKGSFSKIKERLPDVIVERRKLDARLQVALYEAFTKLNSISRPQSIARYV